MSVRKISPTVPSLVHARRDVALVAGDRELVCDRLALDAASACAAGRLRRAPRVPCLLEQRVDVGRLLRALLRVGAQRLCRLRAVAVDRQRLDAQAPRLRVGVGDVLDRRLLGQVDRLRDRARDERLHGAHHLDVAHVRDRPLADSHVEHRQVLLGQARGADDRAVLGQMRLDLLDLRSRSSRASAAPAAPCG